MIDATVVTGLDWFWIGVAATAPLLGGLLVAWPIWIVVQMSLRPGRALPPRERQREAQLQGPMA